MSSHAHLEQNRQPDGKFGSAPATESTAVDLLNAEKARASQLLGEFRDQVRADYPDARSAILEESEMGSFIASVRDGDGTEIATGAELDYDDYAEDISSLEVADVPGVEYGPVEEDGTSRTTITL